MKNSFVRRICKKSDGKGFYFRGPNNLDNFHDGIWPQQLAKIIAEEHVKAPNAKIILTGYSRGAAIVIDTALHLKVLDIEVDAMFLFDAVSLSARLLGLGVPNNVRECNHAFRDPASNSRKSFGNCGVISEPGVNYQRAWFMTTHGGVGSAPWGEPGLVLSPNRETPARPEAILAAKSDRALQKVIYEGPPDYQFTTITVKQEVEGMNDVADWMLPKLKAYGLDL